MSGVVPNREAIQATQPQLAGLAEECVKYEKDVLSRLSDYQEQLQASTPRTSFKKVGVGLGVLAIGLSVLIGGSLVHNLNIGIPLMIAGGLGVLAAPLATFLIRPEQPDLSDLPDNPLKMIVGFYDDDEDDRAIRADLVPIILDMDGKESYQTESKKKGTRQRAVEFAVHYRHAATFFASSRLPH